MTSGHFRNVPGSTVVMATGEVRAVEAAALSLILADTTVGLVHCLCSYLGFLVLLEAFVLFLLNIFIG